MNICLRDLNINYSIQGEGSCVLFLHGWGADITMYAGLLAHLAASGHKVYALDMPGVGKSDEPPVAWCVDDYTDLVSDFISALEIKETALIGHSFGGRVIAKLIARQQNKKAEASSAIFTRVILMDAAGIKPKKKLKARYRIALYKSAKFLFRNPVMQFLYPDYIEHMRKRNGSSDYNSASPVMRGTLVRVVNEDLKKELHTITQPTLLLWGDHDTTTPVSDAECMKKLIADSDIVLVPGGHFSYIDSPALVYGAMSSFLEEECGE